VEATVKGTCRVCKKGFPHVDLPTAWKDPSPICPPCKAEEEKKAARAEMGIWADVLAVS
jgi:hypothetical protein